MNVFIGLLVLCTSIWVFSDARKIGVKRSGEKAKGGKLSVDMGPLGWAICCLLLWIIAFPTYLIKRPEFKKEYQS